MIREYCAIFPSYKPDEVYEEEFNTVIMFLSESRRSKEYQERREDVKEFLNS